MDTFTGISRMAPEVMEQLHGYDFKADIWSFGITALELAHGHAPFSKYPPMKVLLMTLQNAPPGLDYERDKKFSKSFKQMIAMCLVKEPSKRPSAEKLLKHTFFKQARFNDYLARTLLEGLPSLGDRLRALKDKEADMLAQKKMPYGQKEELSQNEYKRGISGWNFNIEDIKAHASLIQDGDEVLPGKDVMERMNPVPASDIIEGQSEYQPSTSVDSKDESIDQLQESEPARSRLPSVHLSHQSLNTLEERHDSSEHESVTSGLVLQEDINQNGLVLPDLCAHDVFKNVEEGEDQDVGARSRENLSRQVHNGRYLSGGKPIDIPLPRGERNGHHTHSQSLGEINFEPVYKGVGDVPSEYIPRTSKLAALNGDEHGDKTKGPVVQQRGRFKVTSESVDVEKASQAPALQKSHSLQVIHQFSRSPSDISPNQHVPNYLHLHNILQQINQLRDCVLSMMKEVNGGENCFTTCASSGQKPTFMPLTEKSLLEAAYEREKELIHDLSDTKWRLICATEEMQKLKMKHPQV